MLFKTLLQPPHILGKNRKRSNKVKVITEVNTSSYSKGTCDLVGPPLGKQTQSLLIHRETPQCGHVWNQEICPD